MTALENPLILQITVSVEATVELRSEPVGTGMPFNEPVCFGVTSLNLFSFLFYSFEP